jgi:hypothetical protein
MHSQCALSNQNKLFSVHFQEMPGFKGKRKGGLTLTLCKKHFDIQCLYIDCITAKETELFLDIVQWFDKDESRQMRYSPSTLQFFLVREKVIWWSFHMRRFASFVNCFLQNWSIDTFKHKTDKYSVHFQEMPGFKGKRKGGLTLITKLANLLMHSQCALSEPISSSRKTRKFTVCRFI